MKIEQLNNGNWLINGVEYAPVEDEKDQLLKRLQAEATDGWEVFFGNREQPDQRYEYQIYLPSFSQWSLRSNETKPLDETHHKTIYRRRLKQPREIPAQPIDPDQLPVRVTLRNGLHYTAVGLSRSGHGVVCVEPQKSGHWIVVNVDGHFNTEKQPVGRDIIHVGGWLSAEELEAMRYE